MLAGIAHLVERCLAKAEVAGSSPVSRSIWHHSQAVRQRSAKPLFPSSILGGASKAKSTSHEVLFCIRKMHSAVTAQINIR